MIALIVQKLLLLLVNIKMRVQVTRCLHRFYPALVHYLRLLFEVAIGWIIHYVDTILIDERFWFAKKKKIGATCQVLQLPDDCVYIQ